MNLSARLGLRRALSGAFVFAGALAAFPLSAGATTIERIVSPGGIVAWLVREPSVPLIALDFAFKGGATQDPPDRAGVATMARWYGAALTSGGSIEMVTSWSARVRAVTPEAVQNAARTWLDRRRSVTGYLVKELPGNQEKRS